MFSVVRGQIYWLVARRRNLDFFQKQYGVLGRRGLREEALRLDVSVLTTPVTGNISFCSFSPGVLWGSGFVCVIFPPLCTCAVPSAYRKYREREHAKWNRRDPEGGHHTGQDSGPRSSGAVGQRKMSVVEWVRQEEHPPGRVGLLFGSS